LQGLLNEQYASFLKLWELAGVSTPFTSFALHTRTIC